MPCPAKCNPSTTGSPTTPWAYLKNTVWPISVTGRRPLEPVTGWCTCWATPAWRTERKVGLPSQQTPIGRTPGRSRKRTVRWSPSYPTSSCGPRPTRQDRRVQRSHVRSEEILQRVAEAANWGRLSPLASAVASPWGNGHKDGTYRLPESRWMNPAGEPSGLDDHKEIQMKDK